VPSCLARQLAVDGSYLYFKCNTSGPVGRVPVDGGTIEYLSSLASIGTDSLVVGGGYAYLSTRRAPLDGGPAMNLVTSGNGGPYVAALDSQNLYWADAFDNQVVSLPITGGAIHTIASTPQPMNVAIDDTAIYWTTYGPTGAVMKTAIGGGGSQTTLASNVSYPDWIVVDDNNVYVTTTGAPSIIAIPKTGGAVTTLVSNQTGTELAVDATSLYWTDFQNVHVMKLTPKF
jgi:hypothetical protein